MQAQFVDTPLARVLVFRRFSEGELTSMPELGRKYTCYSCHTKFYDLGKPEPLCPKCGSDQRDAEDAPVVTSHRGRSRAAVAPPPVVIDEPEEAEFGAEGEAAAGDEDEEEVVVPDRDAEPDDEDEEEEDY